MTSYYIKLWTCIVLYCWYYAIYIVFTWPFLDNSWRVFNWPYGWEFTFSRCQPCTAPCRVTGKEFPVRFTRFRHNFTVQSGRYVHQGDSVLRNWLWCSSGECHYANCGYVYHLTHTLFIVIIVGVIFPLILDAIVRPPCESGHVNSLINELLVHVGLIKVNIILRNFLVLKWWGDLYNHVFCLFFFFYMHSRRTRNSSQWKILKAHFWLWGMWSDKIISLQVQQIYSSPF